MRINNLLVLVLVTVFATTILSMPSKHSENLETIIEQGMKFEIVHNCWLTEANMLKEIPNTKHLWCSRSSSYSKLNNGLELSTEHVKQGKYSGKWSRHNYYPSLRASIINGDWSRIGTVSIWIFSKVATNEKITFAVHTFNSNPHQYGFYYIDFTINWTGWRKLYFPINSFYVLGKPEGWRNVDSIAFYTKIFNRQPNPYAVLYLDDISLNPK